MNLIKILLTTGVSLMLSACQGDGIKKWNNTTGASPVMRVGSDTENVVKISYALGGAQGAEQNQDHAVRLQQARDWINRIGAESITVEELQPIELKNIDTVNPNAYLYIDEYSVRLGKVRIGKGKYHHLRIAALGSGDKQHIYSDLTVYNCRERKSVTAIVYTYTANNGETKAFAPQPKWHEPGRGSAQRWLLNAVCSATLIKEEDDSPVVGYSVLLNKLTDDF
ncbi:hypothetical protein ACWA5Z_07460 [Testudinibacter sp. P80/BLE/0925]|uniref:hypothetical protein n=1 Tax=Testudinibacter sp. TW-1 TaxID=3417757 RepID=UPI003D3639BC